MDHEAFDRLARVLGVAGSRRAALGALLGTGVLGAAETVLGKKKRRKGNSKGNRKDNKDTNNQRGKNRRAGGKRQGKTAQDSSGADPVVAAPAGDGIVTAEATCSSPGPSSNLSGCNFTGADFSGDDLSGSRMVATIFRNATLVGTDLSSSNMKDANFNGANLCGADLSSSTLTNADFRNANLTRADLHSSGCKGLKTNSATVFCQTIMCNGTVRNDDCPAGAAVCCDAGECEERICRTTECRDSGCFYGEQINNQPGTLCEAPQVCCNGNCCAEGQKCCGSTCIDDDACCTDGEEKCPTGAECINGDCEVTCIALDEVCTSADECCGPGPRDCRDDRIFDPTQRCCIAHGGACTGVEFNSNCCRISNDQSEAGAVCRGGTCCTTSGDRCQNSGQCCQNPAPQVCQPVSTCGGGLAAVCCQPAGAPCGDQCDCCDGYCVNGACSATCLPNGQLCDDNGACCTLQCGGLSQPARCDG